MLSRCPPSVVVRASYMRWTPHVAHTTDNKLSFRTCPFGTPAPGTKMEMGISSSLTRRRSARRARVPHACHVAPRPQARPVGPPCTACIETGRGRVHKHHPLTQVRAGGLSDSSARVARCAALREMWCVIVNACVAGFMQLRFHAVAVSSICGRTCVIHAVDAPCGTYNG